MALSSSVYTDFHDSDRNKELRNINFEDPENVEKSALPSLNKWKLIDFQPSTSSGFRAAAFQSPSSSVNIDLSNCNELIIKRVLFA